MADNSEHPDPVNPEGALPPDSHSPSDPFDAAALAPPDPTPRAVSSAPLTPSPRPSEVPPPPADDDARKMSIFPAVLGLLLVGVLALAWFLNRQKEGSAGAAGVPPAATAAPVTPAPTPAPAPELTAKTEALEGKVKDLAGEVEKLTGQVKAFEEKLNHVSKPAAPPDIKPLESKVNDLARSVAAVAPLNERVGKIGDRVGSVDGTLKSVKGELAVLKEEIHKAVTPSPEPKPAANGTTAAMTEGIDLFKAGKYKEANDVFSKLASEKPKDARVYYYAALTRGLTTHDWQGETLATAAKGAALEKSGSPKPAEIDATFADLPATLKPWVTFFRTQAK
jgi:TolA-binding protein